MRLRADSPWEAGWKRAQHTGARTDVAETILADPTPDAQPGDVWIIRQNPEDWRTTTRSDAHPEWPAVGYALTCPNESCRYGVHEWTHASNCDQKLEGDGPRCVHQRDAVSCWTWSGSVEAGDLTASPSLHSQAPAGCGWHGHLRNGQMVG